MARLQALRTEDAAPAARKQLEGVERKLGMTPNLMRTMAHSPAVLEAYLGFGAALAKGSLSARLRERIALAVSEANGCRYCLAAHSTLGRMVGLSDEELLDSRRGESPDGKVEAALRFALTLLEKRGWADDEDLARVRRAGYSDGEIAEIVANVVATIFTNYFNHVAGTEVDFPPVSEL